VAIVNETLARTLWTASPLGRRFRIDGRPDRVLTVVGVVKDLPARPGADAPQPVFYQPFSQVYAPDMKLLVQVRDRPAVVLDAIRRDIQNTYADLAILDLRTLDEYRAANGAFRRQVATGLAVVAAVGLVLSSLGLLGVVSYGVRERAREFGIRLALGARAADVRWMVMRQGLALTLLGLLSGIALSLAVAGVLRSLVVGISVRDPLTIAAVSVVLSIVSAIASYVPARWATSLEPASVLRSE
jgi:putative ABC transport system permease protein